MILWNMEGCVESELFQNLIHQWVLKWMFYASYALMGEIQIFHWPVNAQNSHIFKSVTKPDMDILQLSSPPLSSSLDLFSVAPKSTPLLHLLYSQFVCLLPVGCFEHYVYHTVIPICLFGPEKPRQGRGQLSTHNCCHRLFLIRSESVVRFVFSM